MRFNAAKCNIMRVSRMRLPFLYSYKLSGQVLDEVKDSKYLGVPISDNLDWSKHITTTKANARLSFIKRNLKDCPQKLKEIAYFSLVRSFVDYASAVWDPHQKFTDMSNFRQLADFRLFCLVLGHSCESSRSILIFMSVWGGVGQSRSHSHRTLSPKHQIVICLL